MTVNNLPAITINVVPGCKEGSIIIYLKCCIPPDELRTFLYAAVDEMTVLGLSVPQIMHAHTVLPIDDIDNEFKRINANTMQPDVAARHTLRFNTENNLAMHKFECGLHEIVCHTWKWII